MWKLCAFVAVCALVGSTMAQPCSPTHFTQNQNNLPSLPSNQFKSVIRALIVNKNMTVEATEYVDETRKMAALKMVQQGVRATILMSYKTQEVLYMIPNEDVGEVHAGPMACMVKNMSTDDNTQLFGMRPGTSSGLPHLYSTSQILNFINGTEVYKGQTTMSGIPVNHWSSCQYWKQLYANFTVDYYFTLPGWQTPSGMSQIPVRAEIQGQTVYPNGSRHNFHHIYQYVNFENYVSDPETIFETPPGVYCEGRKAVRQPPKLGNHFYYREEISNPPSSGFALVQESDIWYDYSLNLVRFDQRSPPKGVSRDFSLSQGPYTVIHDFTIGVQYTIANDLGICSIDPIPLDAVHFDAVYNITRQHVSMRGPNQFFNLDLDRYIYAGQRLARGQNCDVYQTFLTNIPGFDVVVFEVYFLKGADDVTDLGSPNSPAAVVPMRVLMWAKGQLVSQYEIHNFDQNNILATQFDVTPCFPGKNSIDFEIFLHIPDTNLMPQMADAVKELLTVAATINNGITALRMQKTRLHWDQWNVYFQGTLLGAAPAIAKFEQSKGKIMASGLGKALHKIWTAADCARQCDNLQEWQCMQFDYCTSTQVCTLGKYANVSTLQVNNSCTHFRRALGGWYDTQPALADVWTSLKNQVFHRQLIFDVPLPDANGNVDISQVDSGAHPLDDTQKMTLTAYYITDEVVSSVNRNPTSSNMMNSFQVVPNKVGKGYNTLMRGLSVDDCATNCLGEITYNCQSFHYCWDSGACFLSPLHPEERPDSMKDSSACDLYYRNYTSNFEKFAGLTVLSSSNIIYQNVISASQCARLCTYYSGFHCESFDFCTDFSVCYLGKTHYYDAPASNVKASMTCAHYSRNYIQDFRVKSHMKVALKNNRVIQDVTATQCAKLCVQEGSFTCSSFDYCGNFTECRLSDALTAGDGQVTLMASAFCDVYVRQFGTQPTQAPTASPGTTHNNNNKTPKPTTGGHGNNNNNNNTPKPTAGGTTARGGKTQQQSGNSGDSGYTGGAMGGLAIGMIALGLILGVVAIMLYMRFFTRRGGDEMSVAFSKQMETITT